MHDDEYGRYITKDRYIDLSPYENILLKMLLEVKGKVITCDDYIVSLYYERPLCTTTTLTFKRLISRLREKLKGEVIIECKHGIGYFIK